MTDDDAEKLASIAKLLRDALALTEGAPVKSSEREGISVLLAGALLKLIQKPPQQGPGQEDFSVDFLLKVLQAEGDRQDLAKGDLAKREAEVTVRQAHLAAKEKEMADREAQIARLEAQLRVREGQLSRREEALRRGHP